MIFPFLKYVHPIWYFNVQPSKGNKGIWPDFRTLEEKDQHVICYYKDYISKEASLRDAAFQAIRNGVINPKKCLDTTILEKPLPIEDNYCFLRRHFKKKWVIYVLLLRLITLHNPIKELVAFLKTRSVRQISSGLHVRYSEYATFQSQLCEVKKPWVSVVIPTLNRYVYLKDVLTDLEKQNYSQFDVIVVDQSEPFEREFYNQFNLNLKVQHQKEKALWLARNTAIKNSQAELILLFDDDSRIEADWIFEHIKALDYFNADISAGVSLSRVGAKIPENYKYFRLADQLDTGNVLMKKDIFRTIGLFDRQFEKQRMGDGEYGMRCFKNGYLSISNPYAKRIHLKVSSGGLRQVGSWDGFRPKKLFAPRPIPSVLYFYRKYFGNARTLLSLLIQLPPSIMPYKLKRYSWLMHLGRALTVCFFPFILVQVVRSWRLSSNMLNEGAHIEKM